MAEILALDWEADRICGVQADVGKSSVRIQKSFSGVIPEDAIGQPERVGAWLQTQLKEHGISARRRLSRSLAKKLSCGTWKCRRSATTNSRIWSGFSQRPSQRFRSTSLPWTFCHYRHRPRTHRATYWSHQCIAIEFAEFRRLLIEPALKFSRSASRPSQQPRW